MIIAPAILGTVQWGQFNGLCRPVCCLNRNKGPETKSITFVPATAITMSLDKHFMPSDLNSLALYYEISQRGTERFRDDKILETQHN